MELMADIIDNNDRIYKKYCLTCEERATHIDKYPCNKCYYKIGEFSSPSYYAKRNKNINFEEAEEEIKKGIYEVLGQEIGRLVDEKNQAYGDSVNTSAEAFKLLYPNGIKPEQYSDALLLVRIWDKMKRIATKKGAFEESPYNDIAGYSILGAMKDGGK